MAFATNIQRPGTLALSYQEVLTAAARLRWKRQEARDAAVFRHHCRQALETGAQDARDAGYAAADIRLASFAVVAFLDETVLLASDGRFAHWVHQPLETELFGTREADEAFYRHLRGLLARPGDANTADLIEVYLLCLLLGFLGMYGPMTGQRRTLIQEAREKLKGIRGPLGELSPAWRVPPAPATPVPRPPLARTAPAPDAAPVDDLMREAEVRLPVVSGGGTLRSLPLLLVIGEPASVKTSTILHCGASKETLAGEVYRDGNVTPTALANLWFARPAVVVEAGATMLADRARWCRLLEKLQPGSAAAARAALVCVDVERLTRSDAADLASRSAAYLRAHLEEYGQMVGTAVPIYVLFTRMDRVAGFAEFVRKLSHDEAGRVVGATLPAAFLPGDSAGAMATRLKDAYSALYRSLALARVELMARESDPEKVEPAYEFPREFHKLRPVVVRLLSELCPPGTPGAPFLRGFYFSGARPIVVEEEEPVVRPSMDVDDVSATGMFGDSVFRPSAPVKAPAMRRKIPQWLFLTHLFRHVLLADYLGAPR